MFRASRTPRRTPMMVVITAQPGQRLLTLPEGASYLGFIFARAETPRQVEAQTPASAHQQTQVRYRDGVAGWSSSCSCGGRYPGGNADAFAEEILLHLIHERTAAHRASDRFRRYSFMIIFICSTQIFHASFETVS